MGSVQSLTSVSDIIADNYRSGVRQVIVCSAMGGVTNQLISMAAMAEVGDIEAATKAHDEIRQRHLEVAAQFGVREAMAEKTHDLFRDMKNLIRGLTLIREYSARSHALLLSFGEKLSTRLLEAILKGKELPAVQYDSTFIRTLGSDYEEDDVDWSATGSNVQAVLGPVMDTNRIPVITGFFGTDSEGQITLLGRGGSDYSAAILSVALGIDQVDIWTDVDGFMTADPRIVDDAEVIDEIGYIEASELCFFGAKVLHPKTIRPVIDLGGRVYIKNTFNPTCPGTKISNKVEKKEEDVISISAKSACVLALDIFGTNKRKSQVFSELFELAYKFDYSIDMIASSEALISFCIEERLADNLEFIGSLEKIAPLSIARNRKIICVVSPGGVQGRIGVAAELFTAFANEGISMEMYSQNNSEIAQLMVVRAEDAEKGIRAIHNKYI